MILFVLAWRITIDIVMGSYILQFSLGHYEGPSDCHVILESLRVFVWTTGMSMVLSKWVIAPI